MAVDRDTITTAGGILLVVLALVVGGVVAGLVPVPVLTGYQQATVTVTDANGTELGTVRARVADTYAKRYTGLSDTASLGPEEGMLFVFEGEANRTFVMRDMAFPLDIVFISADGRITRIRHAPVPPPRTGERQLTAYRGRAKWVLEVNRNWTATHDVSVGDRVIIES